MSQSKNLLVTAGFAFLLLLVIASYINLQNVNADISQQTQTEIEFRRQTLDAEIQSDR
jgi:CHASE3 domain sensor protein